MSEVRSLFRFCPACGRRFHVKLVSKTLTDDRKESEVIKQSMVSLSPTSGFGMARYNPYAVVVEENVPITIDVKDFQYTYKCKHCGHIWSESHVEESKA